MKTDYYYITKYALTTGIMAVEAGLVVNDLKGKYITVHTKDGPSYGQTFSKSEWFTTLEEAQNRVEQKKEARLRQLRKAEKALKTDRPVQYMTMESHGRP